MKYAVPVSGGSLCGHFGGCEQFAIFDVDEATGKIVGQETLSPPEHAPGVYPAWLAGLGAKVILAGGIGGHAVNLFAENNIRVVSGIMESDPAQAVLKHVAGALATGDNSCNHDENHVCEH